ncbi:hypothetical protein LEMLEM_LOCUS21234, partial [Lemmus lemmus]
DSTLEDSGGRGRRWSRLSGYSPRRAELGSRAPGACAVRAKVSLYCPDEPGTHSHLPASAGIKALSHCAGLE